MARYLHQTGQDFFVIGMMPAIDDDCSVDCRPQVIRQRANMPLMSYDLNGELEERSRARQITRDTRQRQQDEDRERRSEENRKDNEEDRNGNRTGQDPIFSHHRSVTGCRVPRTNSLCCSAIDWRMHLQRVLLFHEDGCVHIYHSKWENIVIGVYLLLRSKLRRQQN